jgi:APA family basic amino acid/polyamine antiporter
MNTIIVIIKIAVILLFILISITSVNPVNWEPFMPPTGWFGVFSGAAVVFFAFIGFDAVVTAAEEIENPQKSLPIGLIGSLGISVTLYVIVGIVLTGVVPFAALAGPDAINAPIAYALNSIGISWGAAIVSVGALAGMTSVMLVMLFGQSRIFLLCPAMVCFPGFSLMLILKCTLLQNPSSLSVLSPHALRDYSRSQPLSSGSIWERTWPLP